ncbi:MAG: REP-associated tyrosine transposase [Candidatus Acidiferrales bacterium]
MSLPRKRIRLTMENYRGPRAYFITTCTNGRKAYFADANLAISIIERLRDCARAERSAIHAYCVLPDHVHALAQGEAADSFLPQFVKRFKQLCAYHTKATHGLALWQTHFHDHILRREDQMDAVAWYIWMNPVRKGLVENPHDYPFSGSFTVVWKRSNAPAELWTPPWRKKRM